MSDRTYRVIVRGTFAGLDDTRRAELLAAVEDHDLFNASFTEAGTLSYDRALHAFNFRYLVRQPIDATDDEALHTGCDRAQAALAERGIGHGPLRGTATSVDDMKINRPTRRN